MITHSLIISRYQVRGPSADGSGEGAKSTQASVSIFSGVIFPLHLSPSPHPLQHEIHSHS